MIVYKIVPRGEWEKADDFYSGSADDQRDGFIHLSTAAQLPGTLARHYAGQSDLMLVAVPAEGLGDALKWEVAPKRGQEFPHLYGKLAKSAINWVKPIVRRTDGEFVLPPECA